MNYTSLLKTGAVLVLLVLVCLFKDTRYFPMSSPERNPPAREQIATVHYDYNWTIILCFNDGAYDFFTNWMWHFERLRISVPLILVAEDDDIYRKLHSKFLSTYHVTVEQSAMVNLKDFESFGTQNYKVIVSDRATHILRHLKRGVDVVYSDVDQAWLKDPFPYFRGEYDLWIEQFNKNRYCTGLIAFKSNYRSIKLVTNWKNGLERNLQMDQPYFNTLLKTANIRLCPLRAPLFPQGIDFYNLSDKQRSGVVVMHNNFIKGHENKLNRFKELGLWFENAYSSAL